MKITKTTQTTRTFAGRLVVRDGSGVLYYVLSRHNSKEGAERAFRANRDLTLFGPWANKITKQGKRYWIIGRQSQLV